MYVYFHYNNNINIMHIKYNQSMTVLDKLIYSLMMPSGRKFGI